MKIILLHSIGGGNGVTTVTANLAAALQGLGHRCLAIDCTPDNLLALHFGVASDAVDGWARSASLSQSWEECGFEAMDGGRVLPFGMLDVESLATLRRNLADKPKHIADICHALSGEPLDYLLLDFSAPLTGYCSAQFSALKDLADYSLLIARADLQSYRLLVSHPLGQQLLTDCEILLNAVKTENELQRDLLLVMRRELEHHLISNIIHHDAAVPEAFAHLQTLNSYAPNSAAALDFYLLAVWCVNKLAKVPS